jgi:hypothetical protein
MPVNSPSLLVPRSIDGVITLELAPIHLIAGSLADFQSLMYNLRPRLGSPIMGTFFGSFQFLCDDVSFEEISTLLQASIHETIINLSVRYAVSYHVSLFMPTDSCRWPNATRMHCCGPIAWNASLDIQLSFIKVGVR